MVRTKGKARGILALVIAGLLVVAVGAGIKAQSPGDAAVAEVNGEIISERELYEELVRRSGREVLEQLMTERLMHQAVAASGITVSDEEVAAEMDRVRNQLAPGISVEDALAQAGLTEDDWAEEIRLDISLRTLLTERLEVTEDEMTAFFEQYKDVLGTDEQVRVRHILVEERADAEAIREELADGADFAELARERSIDRGSAARGGDLGWVSRGQMVAPFEDMAFSNPVGELSPVFETDFGFHILLVEEKQEAEEANYEESREDIRAFLMEDKLQQAFQEWLQQVREDAEIEIYL